MLDINDTKMRYEDNPNDKNHATCTCEPLDRGYGTTIGSSLKRILLSSIQGAAVVAVKFAGANDVQDQLAGVEESIQEIILNLRELSIRPLDHAVKAYVKIDATEDTNVTAADIICQDTVEILNPEKHLATVAAGHSFEMEIKIENGYGYVAAEKNQSAEAGMISMDAVYSPIKRVEYKVQNTRVGNTTDYDRLILDIETDGTITPAEAMREAASLMIDVLSPLWQLADTKVEEPNPDVNNVIIQSGKAVETITVNTESDELERPIEDLELNVRPANCMKRAGINTIGDLIERSEDEVKNLRNLGSKSYTEIIAKLAERGLVLKSSD